MNKTVRESKFKSKINEKTNSKALLPTIDAFTTKYVQNPNKNINKKNSIVQKLINQNKFDNLSFKKCQNQQTNQSIAKQPNNYDLLAQNIKAHIHYSGQKRDIQEINNQSQTISNIMNRTKKTNFIQIQNIKGPQENQMWNLNHNLKQFNETRKAEFYKNQNNSQINQFISKKPEKIGKNKTQTLKSMFKIYATQNFSSKMKNPQRQKGSDYLKKLYIPHQTFRQKRKNNKNKSFSNPISSLEKTLYGTLPVRKIPSSNYNLQSNFKTLTKQPQKTFSESKIPLKDIQGINPYLKTFINGSHLKREKSNQNLQILQLNNNYSKDQGNQKKKMSNFRKNRFQKIDKNKKQQIYDNNSSNQIDFLQHDQNRNQIKDINNIQPENQISNIDKKNQNMFSLQKGIFDKKLEQRQKIYEFSKSIDKINKTLLRQVDDYIQYNSYQNMPISSIEFYINSLTLPQFLKNENNNRQINKNQYKQIYGVTYDFQFHKNQYDPLQVHLNQNKKKH